jgi:hypothetical protein
MARKKWFLVIDTETTQTNRVADFGAVVCDKRGNVEKEAGLLVRDFFLDREKHPLFHTRDADPLWGRVNLPRRYAEYDAMLANGQRMLASVAAINRWLYRVLLKYNPTVTAYNLAFDLDKLRKSGIDVSLFDKRFCLWHASVAKWADTRAFKQFALDNHLIGNRTKTGGMTMRTNAEVLARFVLNNPCMDDEPHTALEDARDYEVPILSRLVQTTSPVEYMNPPAYNWRNWQLRDHYKVR